MCVGRGEQQRAKYHPQKTANVAFEHAVDEKSKNKLLDDRGDCDRENNDQNPFFDRAGCTEELDDALLAWAATEKPLINTLGKTDQWISKKQQDGPSA